MRNRKKIKNKKRKKKLFYLVAILLLLIILILLVQILWAFKISQALSFNNIPALSLDNFVKVDIDVAAQNIFLTSGCYRVTMVTSLEQIGSIALALENITTPRPNAHDLFARSLKNFDISLLFVKIHSLRDGTYYAKLFLKQGNNLLILDSRPSDAIALASRTGSSVYLNKELLNYAQKIC